MIKLFKAIIVANKGRRQFLTIKRNCFLYKWDISDDYYEYQNARIEISAYPVLEKLLIGMRLI